MATAKVIKLNEEQAKVLRDLRVDTEALDQTVKMLGASIQPRINEVINLIMTQAQMQVRALMLKGKAAWDVIGQANGLDLQHQNWELHPDGEHIVLLGERYDPTRA